MKKGSRRALKLSGLILILLVGGFVIANSIDEELNPEIPALLARLDRPVPREGNAFYFMLGMWSGAETDDILQNGVAVYESHLRRGGNEPEALIGEGDYVSTGFLALDTRGLTLCAGEDSTGCLSDVRQRRTVYARVLQDNALLLTRYASLMKYDSYQEPMATAGPWVGQMISLHKLYLADIARQWAAGQRDGALMRLVESHEFWRRLAGAETSLMTRMVAVAILFADFRLLDEFIEECGDCRVYADPLSGLLEAFSSRELSLYENFMREYAWVATNMLTHKRKKDLEIFGESREGALLVFFYKPNTTLNSTYELYRHLAQAYSLPPRDYLAARPELKRFLEKKASPSPVRIYFNLVDSYLTAVAVPTYLGYYETNFALEDQRRLLSLKWRLREQGIGKEGVNAFLAALDAESWGSIATGELPRYDIEKGRLYYDYREVNEDMKVFVPLYR